MPTILLDSHVLEWWSSDPERLSTPAHRAIDRADGLAVSAMTWYELAWLARHERIAVPMPLRAWLETLSGLVQTMTVSPAIAETAASLPSTFPNDPSDRIIYATAIETGWRLITKDERLREHKHPRQITIW